MTSHLTSQLMGYQMLECIGEGAYGAVYRARQEAVEREVAVKIILPEFANRPEFIRRFESEAQLIAQLEHIHIVPLYDYWRDPDGAYLVMRLMKGGSLEEALIAEETWSPEQAARLVDQIASALEAAHQHGVVHRDLKPANILLDEAGNAYLSDFGIAKELGGDSTSTATGAIMGTPAYLTPEQVQSQPVTPQTDIYALGVLLYEMLVGKHPFPDSSTGELVALHLNEPLPYVRDSRPELPAALDGVIQRATAKNPADRYPTALSLAEDFRRALQLQAEPTEISEAELYNPYKGLRAFQEIDCDDFFGREALTGQLLAHLAASGESSRFLAVVGPSGSGKSSVVKAGLLPSLRKGALPGCEQWFIVEMHPGSQPLKELQLALLSITADPEVNLGELLSQGVDGLKRAAWSALPGEESELLLVIDQFEELFILVGDEKLRTHFLESLHSAVSDPEGRVRVVITLRADYYDRPLMYPHFGRLVEEHTTVVLPLTTEELQQAIQGPADRVGAVMEKGLVAAITSDVVDQPGTLPLLQYALTELFERREGRMLTNQAYQAIGGVLGALGRRAEEVYSALEAGDKEVARQMFLRLVTLGEGAEDTRRRVLRSDLESLFSGRGAAISQVIDTFGKARLLSFDRDPTTRGPTVEVAHEALLREWRRLREWLDESRSDIRMQLVLSNSVNEWIDGDKDPSFLLRGSRLAQFEGWAQETTLALTADEMLFLQISLEDEAQRKAKQAALERRSRNFLRALVGVFAVAAVIAIGLTIFAFNQQGIAQDNALQADQNAATALAEADARATQQSIAESEAFQRATAEAVALQQREDALRQASIGLAGQAELHLDSPQPELAVLLALEAISEYPYTWQAERALAQAVIEHKIQLVLKHDGWVDSISQSPDGTRLLTGSDDNTTRVWDANSGEELLRLSSPTGARMGGAKWNPAGDRILSPSEDGETLVWNAENGEQLLYFNNGCLIAGWSPDGTRFHTSFCPNDDSVSIYNAATGDLLFSLPGYAGQVKHTYWSPDSARIITSTGQVWDAQTGEELFILPGIQDQITPGKQLDLAISPDGTLIAGGSPDYNLRIWDAATGSLLHTVPGPTDRFAPTWSPSGHQLAAGSRNGQLVVWDTETWEQLFSITGITAYRMRPAWSPDGTMLLSGGDSGEIKIWDGRTGEQLLKIRAHTSEVSDHEWLPSGQEIMTTGSDGTAKVWDVSAALPQMGCRECNRASPFGGWYSNVIWWSSGEKVVRGFYDDSSIIWNPGSGEQMLVLSGAGDIFDISPQEDKILTLSTLNGEIRLVDLLTGDVLLNIGDHDYWRSGGVFSPDGDQFATFGFLDGGVKIWDTNTGQQLLTLAEKRPFSVDWSPVGSRIAVSDNETESGGVRIWDANNGDLVQELLPGLKTSAAIWSPDGAQLATFSTDNVGRIWDAASGEELISFPAIANADPCSWSPDGNRIQCSGLSGFVVVWEANTGNEIIKYEIGSYSGSTWSPDGKHIAVGDFEGDLHVYPAWQTLDELVEDARGCCVIREITPEEREQFGLSEN